MADMRNLDITLLRTLLEIASASSMTLAARRLHMTQGAVSQQIQRLEAMLGQSLIQRSKTGTELTPQGRRLLPEAQKLIDLNDAMIASFFTPSAPTVSGTVRLGVPHDLIGTHLPPILHAFNAQFPSVDVILVTGSSIELRNTLDTGGLDLALIEEMQGSESGATLRSETPVWVGKVGGTAWQKRPLPVSLVSASCAFRTPMIAALAEADIALRNTIDYPSLETTLAMVESDLAITLLLPSTVPDHLACLGAEAGLPRLPAVSVSLQLSARATSEACKALADAIRKSYGNIG